MPVRLDIPKFLFCLVLFVGISFVYSTFQLEGGESVVDMLYILMGGFVIHSLIPKVYRSFVFIGLFLLILFYVFSLQISLFVLGLSIISFLICHVPIVHNAKTGLMVVFITVLLSCQLGYIDLSIPKQSIAIFGGIFMFRIMVYLYDLKYEKKPSTWSSRISYFLMPPNVLFPLFPIVDFKLFQRSYYNQQDVEIYLRGIQMLIRGIFHLVLYRIINLYVVPSLNEVDSILSLFSYIVFSYTLILRLSGSFHLMVGLLCLFGYNLPDAFNNYFLASGFDDYWRRINVYWKDFILKVFYYPVYFKVKKYGTYAGSIITTIIIFIINWFLHSYQWTWITGKYSFSLTDILFWAIFGGLVVFSIIVKAKDSKKSDSNKFISSLVVMGKIIITFMISSLLWSLWLSPTLNDWLLIMSAGGLGTFYEYGSVIMIVFVILFVGGLFHYLINNKDVSWINVNRIDKIGYYANYLILIILLAVSSNSVRNYLEESYGINLTAFVNNTLNEDENDEIFAGYYDEILKRNQFGTTSFQSEKDKAGNWVKLNETGIILRDENPLANTMLPNQNREFKNANLVTNSLGLRDLEYTKTRVNEAIRFGILGSSIEMGSGVNNEEVFEHLIEDRLNSSDTTKQYEIINFAMSGNNLLNHSYNLNHRLEDFELDYVMVFNHDREWQSINNSIKKFKSQKRITLDLPWLDSLLTEIELPLPMSGWGVRKTLSPYRDLIFEQAYKQFAEECKRQGVVPILVHIPNVEPGQRIDPPLSLMKSIADKNGIYFIDLSDVFAEEVTEILRIDIRDNHPSALGHQLIAKQLYEELVRYLALQ